MIFKGTPALAPGVFDREIENRGGMTNAATSHDYTHYFLTTAPYWKIRYPPWRNCFLNAAIPEDEFVREREVVQRKSAKPYDDPELGRIPAQRECYQHHPYGRSVLGTEPELMKQSPEAMRCFHRAHYQPENMTVVIVGGIACLELSRTFQQFSEAV